MAISFSIINTPSKYFTNPTKVVCLAGLSCFVIWMYHLACKRQKLTLYEAPFRIPKIISAVLKSTLICRDG